jgi:hypothetical protein
MFKEESLAKLKTQPAAFWVRIQPFVKYFSEDKMSTEHLPTRKNYAEIY